MPVIGNKAAKKTRYLLANGFKKLLIRNEKDIELLLMNNRVYCGELANSLSAKTR
jgi:large subunit ribosomal protein L32e